MLLSMRTILKEVPIRIAFFDDRIEIENHGILLPGMTVEDMLQGVSKIRNHVIARVFRELNLMEQWGSGVRRMFREAEALGLSQPEIIEVGMRVRFIVYLAEAIAIETTDSVTGEAELRPELPTQLRPKLRPESHLADKVLIHLIKNDAGKAELAYG